MEMKPLQSAESLPVRERVWHVGATESRGSGAVLVLLQAWAAQPVEKAQLTADSPSAG